MEEIVVQGQIHSKIYMIHGKQVMLDRDLAELYQVDTRVLNQAVKRNNERFPDDFMFQLREEEYENLISQIVISSSKHGGVRKMPYVFTEQGVYMLSGVLKSNVAVDVSISIMRTFTKLREFTKHYNVLAKKIMASAMLSHRNFFSFPEFVEGKYMGFIK